MPADEPNSAYGPRMYLHAAESQRCRDLHHLCTCVNQSPSTTDHGDVFGSQKQVKNSRTMKTAAASPRKGCLIHHTLILSVVILTLLHREASAGLLHLLYNRQVDLLPLGRRTAAHLCDTFCCSCCFLTNYCRGCSKHSSCQGSIVNSISSQQVQERGRTVFRGQFQLWRFGSLSRTFCKHGHLPRRPRDHPQCPRISSGC